MCISCIVYTVCEWLVPVSVLDPHGNAVVELQACDVPQPQHEARPVGPADALGHLLQVSPWALAWRHSMAEEQFRPQRITTIPTLSH